MFIFFIGFLCRTARKQASALARFVLLAVCA